MAKRMSFGKFDKNFWIFLTEKKLNELQKPGHTVFAFLFPSLTILTQKFANISPTPHSKTQKMFVIQQ